MSDDLVAALYSASSAADNHRNHQNGSLFRQAAAEIARLTERCDAYREVVEAAQAYVRASWNAPVDPITQREWGELSRAVAALASPAGEQKDKTT